jgi:peptidoglycan/LPS O-acetylase OafA/YrhL
MSDILCTAPPQVQADVDRRLPASLSIYLDLVRFSAAMVVVLAHSWPILFANHPLPWPAHHAVVVFFVLSGLVIAHATQRPGLTWSEYAIHRFARILSVTIPALILAGVVSLLVGGFGLSDAAPPAASFWDGVTRLGINLASLGQVWQNDISPPLNRPFWSLNFEVWYYVLFGAWTFLRGRHRVVTISVVILIVGPKILLLLPVWLVGVTLYRHLPRWNDNIALIVFLLTGILSLAVIQLDVLVVLRGEMIADWPDLMSGLGGANQFAGDWLLALIIAFNFAAAACLGRFAAPLYACERAIRCASSCTFSAYLYHMPLIVMAYLVLGLRGWVVLVAVALGVVVLAQLTERQLPATRRLIRWIGLNRFAAIL